METETTQRYEMRIVGFLGREAEHGLTTARIRSIEGNPLTLHISSMGGLVTWSQAVYAALGAHKGGSEARVYIAGSAAPIVALGCDKVLMWRKGLLAFHNAIPADGVAITPQLLREMEAEDAWATAITAHHMKQPVRVVRDWMTTSRSFSAQEALDIGFCQELFDKEGD